MSHPFWVLPPLLAILAPVALVLTQPDLGTSIMLLLGGGAMIFLAGVSLWYFAAAIGSGVALVTVVLQSRGTDWALLREYQFKRIETFSIPRPTRSAPATTSPRRRSPWARAGSRGAATCRARRAA